jgi:hypothetical protein
MKFIPEKIHGIIDYFVVFFLIAAPVFFGFDSFTAIFTYALAIVHLILTLLTDFDSGVFKVVSFPLHGIIELIVGIALIILAFTLFSGSHIGKLFYIGVGAAVLITWLFTDYKAVIVPKP